MMPLMPAREHKEWAKEQLLSVIDNYLDDKALLEMVEMDYDDRHVLEIERDRVAVLFHLPQRFKPK